MDALRTPEERFADLPGWPYEPRYVEVDDGEGGRLRVHHVDEGPAGAPVVLLMHGEPTWSYLYRHVIPPLVEAGLRVVAPDLVGFGRSDKPTRREDHTYARHVGWMAEALFDRLDLRDVTLFGQDWGSLIGLRLVGEHPDRIARVAIGNGGLPTGDRPLSEAFAAWQRFAREAEQFPVGAIVAGGCTRTLAPEEVAAYDAPFPTDDLTAGPRTLPALVPTSSEDPASAANRAAWDVLRSFDRPFLCCFSDGDPVTAGGERVFHREVPGTAGQAHVTLTGAGHFLQEDRGRDLGRLLAEFVGAGT